MSMAIVGLSNFLKPSFFDWNTYYTMNGFYEEPENTIETVFPGSSVVVRGIIPTELYEDYGICSYNLSLANAPMLISYYWPEEAYRLHSESMTTVVLDVSGLRSDAGTGIVYAYETTDLNHLNYYGATKLTRHFGKYLVENCDVTDIRGNEKYSFMEDRLHEYHERVTNEVALQTSETITEYLDNVLKYDNTVIMSVKNSASTALTEEQRQYFSEIGLEKLSEIDYRDSYIGIIEDGKVIYEDRKLDSADEPETPISYTGVLKNGKSYSVTSGGYHQGKTTSCLIDNEPYTEDLFGINITVYNNTIEQVVDYTSFQTDTSRSRERYGSKTLEELLSRTGNVPYDSNGLYSRVMTYVDKTEDLKIANDLRKSMGENDIFTFLNKYINDENKLILISAKDDASKSLTEKDRESFTEMGLTGLSKIDYRNSYLAYIDGGNILYDACSADELVVDELGIYVKSAGRLAGSESSIRINGIEYSENEQSLNIVIYDKALKRVVDQEIFNTCKEAIQRAEH